MQENKIFCHDCRKKIQTEKEEIKNGKMLVYDNRGEKTTVTKCDDCFAKNPSLTNFQECEVYSRVVGYLRPVSQWNTGKKREYSERKEYAAF
ncbi:MAG: anaerobic ribonucleoside-triphosphate reductase [Candidatus Staskawiczbacteria bacterium]|nr:anaerobic ribonucleoside-triphosphate reductase [Candidatus Staskawiczbacteria bacterium]